MAAKKTDKTAKKTIANQPAATRAAAHRSEPIDIEEPIDEGDAPIPDDLDDLIDDGALAAASDATAKFLAGTVGKTVAELGDDLASGKKSLAAQSARVLDEIVDTNPDAVVQIIDRYCAVIGSPARRPAQSAAKALPLMARIAPARVARHLPKLKASYTNATQPGKDGLVRTFAGLCTASVAYQKRLEDVLNEALGEADAKTLIVWTQVVLPALKGEPHARARATVEGRLGRIPKVHAQKIADFLGIKLRLRYR